ncbi:outer membrane beta-barrel protein [Helicobacter trogontum]|uniref:Outer membrane beta-barrel protein n=1 Tax=Helicobacter trogontum TaxID=50960 RepID=A0A4U8S6L0_9HELI|nr:outer membrane beta-barrel protein [Helicobacter trogontum]TLD81436.1 outer membrane beta-barrel protein [Helicobacter trogontum]
MCKKFGKIALIAAMACTSSFMVADEGNSSGSGSGFFVGINTGYTVSFDKTITTEVGTQSTTENSTTAPDHINVGVQLGYNYMFTNFLGLRGYVNYNYGFAHSHLKRTEQNQTTDDSRLISAHTVSGNIDVLLNFLNSDTFSFGVYAGVGFGYMTMSSTSRVSGNGTITNTITPEGNGFILPINAGLMLTANGHHRFELGFKIPTLGVKYVPASADPQNIETITTRNLITTIGYTYIF